MRTVIETKSFSPSRRVNAFRQAICDIYANVDVSAEDRTDYNGVLRESRFGNVNLTECEAWPLVVERGKSHIANSGKECHFVQLMQHGRSDIVQGEAEIAGTPGDRNFFLRDKSLQDQMAYKIKSSVYRFTHGPPGGKVSV